MNIIKERERVETEYFTHDFVRRDIKGSMFSFPCEQSGYLLNLNPAAIENYRMCVSGEYDVIDCGIRPHTSSHTEPAIGICNKCGEKVELSDSFANPCDKCGTEYNAFGQELAPREQWGWETGEQF